MVENTSGPYQKHKNNSDDNMEIEDEELGIENEGDEDYPESEEFQAIDNQLNMISSVLDNLEEKNDTIIAELATLLKESREMRMQIQLQQCQGESAEEETQQN